MTLGDALPSVLAFVLGYVVTSFLESVYHEVLQHSSLRSRWGAFWNSVKPAARLSHTEIHHRRTFRGGASFTQQFRLAEERAQLDRWMDDNMHASLAASIRAERYGTTWGASTVAQVLLTLWVPLLALAVPLFGPRAAMFSLLPSAAVVFFSTHAHQYLHMGRSRALQCASLPMRCFLRSPYGAFLFRYHWMHHRYETVNFNFLLLADFARGRYRRPSERDVAQMRVDDVCD